MHYQFEWIRHIKIKIKNNCYFYVNIFYQEVILHPINLSFESYPAGT